ncbi:MAG: hypothetical protein LBI87_00300 [Candidatus Accumulibacter sp.]|jgi:hypothetical protein|nr:hypothetical protein [Accumulibacter sp.]
MQQYLIYIIPAAIVLAIFLAGLAYSRKAARYKTGASDPTEALPAKQGQGVERAYEKAGVTQIPDHPLGVVQDVIRGRIRFALFGLVLLGVALLGLYAIWVARTGLGGLTTTATYRLIATIMLAGAAVYAMRLVSFATCRVKLRRLGFEVCSVFGTTAYAYKGAEFRLFNKWESRFEGNGYRPALKKTPSYNRVWVWQVVFKDEGQLLELKSSRYAWLYDKARGLMDALGQ